MLSHQALTSQLILTFSYKKNDLPFSIKLSGENSTDLEMIIWSVFEKALNEGTFNLYNFVDQLIK